MAESDAELNVLLGQIKSLAAAERVRITQHAQQEMAEEEITLDQVLQAIRAARVLENYPRHRRGPCCLICGRSEVGRPLHMVCTTAQPMLVIIAAYEPKPPRWKSLTERAR